MMQQYCDIRAKLPKNTLLLFRLGDFYEIFQEDAEEGARLLGITLTKRNGMPMAGIPYHAAETYINKALTAGKKVAICDQVGTPQPGKLVKRALTRILTPGTTFEASQLTEKQNHYLLALNKTRQGIHAAWLDLSTGDFQIATSPDPERLLPLFNALNPKEIILAEEALTAWSSEKESSPWYTQCQLLLENRPLSEVPGYCFDEVSGAREVMKALGVLNLDGFGISKDHPALGAAGALIHYTSENLCTPPKNLRTLKEYRFKQALLLDPATLRNLEIFKSAQGTHEGSLLAAMDATETAAGGRLLEQYLASPSQELPELLRRQESVAECFAEPGTCAQIHETLSQTRDITRILSRLQNRLRSPRELGAISETLACIPPLLEQLSSLSGPRLTSLKETIHTFDELRELLAKALLEELPSTLQEGGYIRDGFCEELDHLRSLTRDNKTWLANLEREEQEKTGIKNLKVKYNGAFGYFIEVSKANTALVPDTYIRKQTMTNAERYTMEILKQKEKEILNAEERSIAQEDKLFKDLVTSTLNETDKLLETANTLAQIDLFIGWAKLARQWNYCCPTLDKSDKLFIEGGRHPVVEQMLAKERLGLAGNDSFVPNNTDLSSSEKQVALITGPNMAGKSTYIRQVALITLMAQIGSWVPAKQCHIGLVDRIFSRVGASDELAKGNSTFMVEMNETANILNNASERSLIILDEIGRGTSTYDGLSIAWAVIEHIHGDHYCGPRTLFATHYHELTQLHTPLPRLDNYAVAVKEWNDQIIFVRQVIPGAADRSYGIQVARLAGLPNTVIDRAKTILDALESEETVPSYNPDIQAPPAIEPDIIEEVPLLEEATQDNQLELF